MSTKIQLRTDNVLKHCLHTFQDFKIDNNENSLGNARKCCEAICRAIVLKKFGDSNGQKIISGEIFSNLRPVTPYPKIPLLKDLLVICKQDMDRPLYYRFEDIRYGGNNSAHDPVSENNNVTRENVELCLAQLKEILKWYWNKFLIKPIPAEIIDAFRGRVDERFLVENHQSGWERLYNDCNCFSSDQKFMLVAPPDVTDLSENQLSILARIDWYFIFDFNPNSKTSGIYKAIHDKIFNKQIRPITIEQKDQRDVTSGSEFALNWFFANGITTLPNSISTSPREWKTTLKYSSFVTRLIKEILSSRIQNIVIIYLWDDSQYIRTIIEAVDENAPNPNLATHFICSDEQEKIQKLKDDFGDYNTRFYQLSTVDIIGGISRTIESRGIIRKDAMHVPARGEGDTETHVDISSKYVSFLDRNIEVLYQGISKSAEITTDEYSFYKGNIISWKELDIDTDVKRNKADDLTNKIRKWLDTSKGAYSIELHHKPGAGGTTLSRRLAYEFHQKYPTVIISKYQKDKTNLALFDLAELTQKPILAIVEAFRVTQNELNALIRKINEDKKHVVILYVNRVFNSHYSERDFNKNVFLEDKTADFTERDRFVFKYSQVALSDSKIAVRKLSEQNPHQCEIIDFALTAYENEFSTQTLQFYIHNYLGKLPASQLKFAGFASLLYYYTQKSSSELWFSNLFGNSALSSQLNQKAYDERYIKKLLIQELNESFEETGFWRPRFSRFATEIIRLTLVGLGNESAKDNWKDFLSRWSVELIKECKASNEFLTTEVREMLKSLFLNRENEDILGKDDGYENASTTDKKFSQLIRHIGNKEQQLEVFKVLVDCYPNEAHFRGHLGRFLYENASEPADYENAENEISKAIEFGEGDFNLWHIKGMCNRRRIEFLIRSNIAEYKIEEILEMESIIQELTEVANEDFAKSRKLNSHNLHGHAAQIQMLIAVINFGRQISNNQSKEDFIADKENIWYGTQLEEVFNLIDESLYIIELSKDLDQSKVIRKSKDMIEGCEANVFALIGNFSIAISRFKNLAETADRASRPYFRRMFVYSTLAGKVGSNPKSFRSAWIKLSTHEYSELKKALENNIREQPENPSHIKIWLQAVRYSNNYISIEDCISTVKVWYDNSINFEIAHLEAAYYLYVMHAIKAISSGDSWGEYNVGEARKYLNECKEKRLNDKFSFEWLGSGDGIKLLVHYSILGRMSSEKRFFEDTSLLGRVEGVITNIYDKQKGKLRLKCGLEAFFVPSNGGFDVTDETELVKFYVGFRQDGLFAWEVQRVEELELVPLVSSIIEIEGFDSPEELKTEVKDTEKSGNINSKIPVIKAPLEEIKLKGLTVVGKIDLSQFDKFKKKKS